MSQGNPTNNWYEQFPTQIENYITDRLNRIQQLQAQLATLHNHQADAFQRALASSPGLRTPEPRHDDAPRLGYIPQRPVDLDRPDFAHFQHALEQAYRQYGPQMHDLNRQLQEEMTLLQNAQVAQNLFRYHSAVLRGDTVTANNVMWELWSRNELPPSLRPQLEQSLFDLQRAGLLPMEMTLASVSVSPALAQPQRLTRALEILHAAAPTSPNTTWLQDDAFRSHRDAFEIAVIQNAMREVNNDPRIAALAPHLEQITNLLRDVPDLFHLLHAAQNDFSPALRTRLQTFCADLDRLMSSPQLQTAITAARQLLQTLRASSGGMGQTALDGTIRQLETVLGLLDRNADNTTQRHLRNILNAFRDGDLNEPTVWETIRNEGVHLCAQIAVSALTTIVCGGNAVLTNALLPTVTFFTREGVQAILHGIGWSNQRSTLWDAIAQNPHYDLATGTFRTTTGREALEYMRDGLLHSYAMHFTCVFASSYGSFLRGPVASHVGNQGLARVALSATGRHLGPAIAQIAPVVYAPEDQVLHQGVGVAVSFLTGFSHGAKPSVKPTGKPSPVEVHTSKPGEPLAPKTIESIPGKPLAKINEQLFDKPVPIAKPAIAKPGELPLAKPGDSPIAKPAIAKTIELPPAKPGDSPIAKPGIAKPGEPPLSRANQQAPGQEAQTQGVPAVVTLSARPQNGQAPVIEVNGTRIQLRPNPDGSFTAEHQGVRLRYQLLEDQGQFYLVRSISGGQPELSQQMRAWMEHDMNSLILDADERAAVARALENGTLQYTVMNREFLHNNYDSLFSREAGGRPESTASLPQNASNYDPARAQGPVLAVYDAATGQYHFINGNNRILLFGSEIRNQNNAGVPVWLFMSPQAFQDTFGFDCRPMRGHPFRFELTH